MINLPWLRLNSPRLHLRPIVIEERGMSPWNSHKKSKFLVHPCQMRFGCINVVPDCSNTICNYPCHKQWDSNSVTQWLLNSVSKILCDLIVQCGTVEKQSSISPCKYLPNCGDMVIHYYVQRILSMSQPPMTSSLSVPQLKQMYLLCLSHICKPSFYSVQGCGPELDWYVGCMHVVFADTDSPAT
jgi:hypothetical protein